MTILLEYDQLCQINSEVLVVYSNDDTLIMHGPFKLEISSVLALVPPPRTIAKYYQSIITALNHKV